MMREKFSEIADQLGCQYDYSEKYIKSLGGSNIPISYHTIIIEYKSVLIKLDYEFGSTTLGEINSTIETSRELPDISVTTKSQIKRLFSKNKNPFIVKCKDQMLKSYFQEILEKSGYAELARNTSFEPEINCSKQDNQFVINTVFYLGFDNKENSILPSIELHKLVIDKVLH